MRCLDDHQREPAGPPPSVGDRHRRWVAYALATGTGATGAADAGVIYSGTLNLTNAWGSTPTGVDLNGGGNDFTFGWRDDPDARANWAGVQSSGVEWLCSTNSDFVRNLSLGTTISSSSATWKAAPSGNYKALATYDYGSGAWASGQWTAGATGYAGIRLVNGTGHNYGWVRFTVPTTGAAGSNLTLVDWAYETTVNASIDAGSTVPAPGALLTLALGAAGVRARRARKE